MKRRRVFSVAFAAGLAWLGLAVLAAPLPAPIRWDIETSRPATYGVTLFRGESVDLEPRFLSYSSAVSLSNATEVVLRYRPSHITTGAWYYAVTGSVLSASEGRIRVRWTPSAETVWTNYVYTLAAKTVDSLNPRGYGTLQLRGIVGGIVTSTPPVHMHLDWSRIENSNVGQAPFATSNSEDRIAVITGQVAVLQRGTQHWDTAFGWGDHATPGYLRPGATSGIPERLTRCEATNAAQQALLVTLQRQVSGAQTTNAAQSIEAGTFLKVDGSRPMTGPLNVGARSITNAVKISAGFGTLEQNDFMPYLELSQHGDRIATLAAGEVVRRAQRRGGKRTTLGQRVVDGP
jgi:hypothetical protein